MSALVRMAASTPSPSPSFNPDSVTPGWVGFAVTFFLAVAAVLLILDMVRRIRRVRYRDEINHLLDDEAQRDDLERQFGEPAPGETAPGAVAPGEAATGESAPGERNPGDASAGDASTGDASAGDAPNGEPQRP